MVLATEYAVFGVLVATIYGVGFFVSFKRASALTLDEVLLGGRNLKTLPLAVSVLASVTSSTGIISFTAHFYAYGMNLAWTIIAVFAMIPVTVRIIIPVLYPLKVTSVFEYLRARFGSKISLTACIMYFIITQSAGAVGIFAAAMSLATIFHISFLWCCLAIGFTGSLYTALGGLRGVVWTDCMQAVIIVIVPFAIIFKILFDSNSGRFTLRPISDVKLTFFMDYSFDFTKDENMWACMFGLCALHLYRLGMDQISVQRYLASRNLEQAKRQYYFTLFYMNTKLITGTVLVALMYTLQTLMGFLLIYWFRDCDPQLSGFIEQVDQLLPFYVKTHLMEFPGFCGLFLCGVVCAATSTISSLINSQAAVVYIDVVSLYFACNDAQAVRITRLLAFIAGIIMTLYSVAIPYLGSATRIILLIHSGITGPFVGLFLMGLIFPWVNSKGAGTATVLMAAFQVWHMGEKFRLGIQPQRMPATLDYCPGNISTTAMLTETVSIVSSKTKMDDVFVLLRLSAYWSNTISAIVTILLGIFLSLLTG
ncbi:unnamed protein product, partial [Ixodes persulcatus]